MFLFSRSSVAEAPPWEMKCAAWSGLDQALFHQKPWHCLCTATLRWPSSPPKPRVMIWNISHTHTLRHTLRHTHTHTHTHTQTHTQTHTNIHIYHIHMYFHK